MGERAKTRENSPAFHAARKLKLQRYSGCDKCCNGYRRVIFVRKTIAKLQYSRVPCQINSLKLITIQEIEFSREIYSRERRFVI